MAWLILTHIFSTLLELIRIRGMSVGIQNNVARP